MIHSHNPSSLHPRPVTQVEHSHALALQGEEEGAEGGVYHWVYLNFLELWARLGVRCLKNLNYQRQKRFSLSSLLLGSSFLMIRSRLRLRISMRVVISFAGWARFTPSKRSNQSSLIETCPLITASHSPPLSSLILATSSLISQEVQWSTCRSPSLTFSSCATMRQSYQLQKALVRRCLLPQIQTISVIALLLVLHLSMLLIKCSCWLCRFSRLRTSPLSGPQLLRAALTALLRLQSARVGFLFFLMRKCQQWARMTLSTISCLISSDSCRYSTKCTSLRSMHFLRLFRAAGSSPCER